MSSKPVRIAIFGMTGAGKTSFINNATGADFEVGHDATSATKNVQQAVVPPNRVGGRKVIIYDTPGFNDTELEDPQLFLKMTNWLANSYKQKEPLNGAIFLQSISHPRVEIAETTAIQLFEKILGDSAFPYAMIVSSFWNQVNVTFATKNESNREKTWQRLKVGGAKFGRFHDTEASALQIVQHFLGFSDAPLLLPQEVIRLNGQVWSTSAARFLQNSLDIKITDVDEQIKIVGSNTIRLKKGLDKMQGWLRDLKRASIEFKTLAWNTALHAGRVVAGVLILMDEYGII